MDAVHPILLRDGDYRLQVVGRTPPAWMQDRAVMPAQITATGTVDDVRPYIGAAAVYVVPLRVGGGSRLKILEAFSMGRAVVSTTVGAEGLEVEPGTHLLLEDTAEGFAAAVTALWNDAERRRTLGLRGRALIEARYRWEQIAPRQGEVWRRAIADSA
jgi:glycosyltransferase involved in cell wall biosynthesis